MAIYCDSLLGAFKMAFETNSWRRQMYTIYFTVGLCFMTLFELLSFVDLYILLSRSEINLEEVLKNICFSLPLMVSILRVTAMRRPPVLKLVKKILDVENVIFGSSDKEVRDIYGAHVKRNRSMNIIYIISLTCECICYLNHFLHIKGVAKVDPITNTTITLKALPVSTWFPFDTQDHYALSYVLSGLYIAIGTIYLMFVDMLSVGMMVFILGQIKILNHIFSNFSKYVCVVMEQFRCGREEASFLTMRECILKHNVIILYINNYNTSMRILTLLDFVQSSVQLASVVLQLLMSKTTVLNVFSYVGFACCMLLRLLLNYWCANEIMIESANISEAVYQSSWYDEPEKVKQMMRLVILRANKALGLQIGPFSTMTLSTFVGIIKTTYSYMMVLYG